MEYDLEQCAHVLFKKGQIHLQNHLWQNNFIKVHLFSHNKQKNSYATNESS